MKCDDRQGGEASQDVDGMQASRGGHAAVVILLLHPVTDLVSEAARHRVGDARLSRMGEAGEVRDRLVFVTWDGPQQPYLKSLFLPLLRGIARFGVHSSVLQFSWGDQPGLDATDLATSLGAIPVEKIEVGRALFPFSYSWSIPSGALALAKHVRRHRTTLVVARSYLPAAIAFLARRVLPGVPWIFDTDGFMPDERVEFGGWRENGPMFKLFRRIEAEAVRDAAMVVTRTAAARRTLLLRYPDLREDRSASVSNGRDANIFRPASGDERLAARLALGIPGDSLLLVYAGSVGPQYLPEQMLEFFARVAAINPSCRLLFLTPAEDLARQAVKRLGRLESSVIIKSVAPLDVPKWLASADVGLAFRLASVSQRAVCPLKVAEYLLCGLPVISSRGIGDLDEQLAAAPFARLISPASQEDSASAVSFVAALNQITLEPLRGAARDLGLRHYSLDSVVSAYGRALGVGSGSS